MSLITTASQTVGPYLQIGFKALANEELASAGAGGEGITLRGRLVDGDGRRMRRASTRTPRTRRTSRSTSRSGASAAA